MDKVKITVLMPVYNGEKFLHEALKSILSQTYQNYEFLIVNDCSTDASEKIIQSYTNPRIRLIQNNKNLGLIDTLNVGLKHARGEYVARMDQDDISMPERLARQVAYLDAHPDVGLLGTTYAILCEARITGIAGVLLNNQDIRSQLLYKCPFGHGTVMFRRMLVTELSGQWYSSKAENAEDYELWSRIALISNMANLPEVLYIWRENPLGISARRYFLQRRKASEIALRNQNNPRFRIATFYGHAPWTKYRNEKITLFGRMYIIKRAFNYAETFARLCLIATKQLRLKTAFNLMLNSLLTFTSNVKSASHE